MKCPYCNKSGNKIIDSRPVLKKNIIRRRRECLNCNYKFTTYEYPTDTVFENQIYRKTKQEIITKIAKLVREL
jgi:transcriptional regulator NrdR family protein